MFHDLKNLILARCLIFEIYWRVCQILYILESLQTELYCHLFTKSRSSFISRILNRGTREFLPVSRSLKPIDFPVATPPFPFHNTCVSERAYACASHVSTRVPGVPLVPVPFAFTYILISIHPLFREDGQNVGTGGLRARGSNNGNLCEERISRSSTDGFYGKAAASFVALAALRLLEILLNLFLYLIHFFIYKI